MQQKRSYSVCFKSLAGIRKTVRVVREKLIFGRRTGTSYGSLATSKSLTEPKFLIFKCQLEIQSTLWFLVLVILRLVIFDGSGVSEVPRVLGASDDFEISFLPDLSMFENYRSWSSGSGDLEFDKSKSSESFQQHNVHSFNELTPKWVRGQNLTVRSWCNVNLKGIWTGKHEPYLYM